VTAGVIAGASVSSLTSSDVGIVAAGVKAGDSVVWLPSFDVGVVAAGVEFGVFCCVDLELFPVVDVVATGVATGAAVVSSGTDVVAAGRIRGVLFRLFGTLLRRRRCGSPGHLRHSSCGSGDRLSGAARILGLTPCLTSCSECIPHDSLGFWTEFRSFTKVF
jgi:hypothetical protein